MNFLVIVVDEMQAGAMGCVGNSDVRTPNLDRLAAQGSLFKNAYCNNPVCMPSRSTMLTGLTPRQHGCVTNGCKLPENIPTVTQILQNNGYKTASFGKLHLQPIAFEESHDSAENIVLWNNGTFKKLPENYYGFSHSYFVGGHTHYCYGDYKNWLKENYPQYLNEYGYIKHYDVHDGIKDCFKLDIPAELHYNNVITDRCISYIDEHKNEKFFAFCALPDPHFPFGACKPYSEMYDPNALKLPPYWEDENDPVDILKNRRKRYSYYADFTEAGLRAALAQTYGMITHIDDNIGRLLDCLDKNGLADNTAVVFMADHGEYLGHNHLMCKDIWPYEAVYKIPYIWKIPGGHKGKCTTPVSLLDFVPTVLSLANVDEKEMDVRGMRSCEFEGLPGRDLSGFLKNSATLKDEPVLIEYDEDWHPGPFHNTRSLVYKDLKITVFGGDGEGLLYNLKSDPFERENLYNNPDYFTQKIQLLELLIKKLARTDRLMDNPRICGA